MDFSHSKTRSSDFLSSAVNTAWLYKLSCLAPYEIEIKYKTVLNKRKRDLLEVKILVNVKFKRINEE